jgi:hypothetical protein
MKLQDLTDKELAVLKQDAIETQDGRLLMKIWEEMNRRNKEI